MTPHLHIAHCGEGGTLSIVVRNNAGETLHEERRAAEGTACHDWQALVWALQYADAQEAKGVTLYSHEPALRTMWEIQRGVCTFKDNESWYLYNRMAWTIIVGRWYGVVRFKAIPRERNVAARITA